MMIELVPAKETGSEQIKYLSGLRAFASNFCLEHRISCIIACPVDEPLDLECVLNVIEEMKEKLINAAAGASHEN